MKVVVGKGGGVTKRLVWMNRLCEKGNINGVRTFLGGNGR